MRASVALIAAVAWVAAGSASGQWVSVEEAKLIPSGLKAGENAGRAVALDGDTAVVGVPYRKSALGWAGSAHVFERNATSWTETGVLIPSAPIKDDVFGSAVSISGDTLVVGAPGIKAGPNWASAGSAYVFLSSGSQWIEQAKLTSSDGILSDRFGTSVAIDGDTILVGAPYNDHAAGIDAGSVYVFERQGVAWVETAKLTSNTQSAGDWFGQSLDLDGSRCLIGAPCTTSGALQAVGVGYTFVRNGSSWSQEARLARDAVRGLLVRRVDHMGRSAALSGDTAVLGAPYFEDRGRSHHRRCRRSLGLHPHRGRVDEEGPDQGAEDLD